jgi:hypothetical protein
VFPNTLEFVALNQRVNKFEYQWPDCLGCTRLVAPITLSNGATTVPLNLRDGVVTEKPEKGIKDTDPLILDTTASRRSVAATVLVRLKPTVRGKGGHDIFGGEAPLRHRNAS